MSAEDDAAPEGDTKKKSCTLTISTVRYLEKIAEVGTHGGTMSAVMTRLIEEGVRQAIRDGFVTKLER
jgi:hypothetical protein